MKRSPTRLQNKMRFIPCFNGPQCRDRKCKKFHGTEIRKSFTFCRFGDACRYKKFCPFLHFFEAAKPGDIIWRYEAPPAPLDSSALLAPKPKEPEPTGPPMPLDSITQILAGFLGDKEFQKLRLVNKACKEAANYVPIQSLVMKWTSPLPTASLEHLSKLTFQEPHPPLEHMSPRLARIAEIQRLRELSVPTIHLQAVLESLPESSLESLEKITLVHPSAVTEFKLPDIMSRLTRLDKLVLGSPLYGFRVDLEVLPKIPRLRRLKLQYVTPSDLKVFQHTRLERVQILRAGIPLLNAILAIPTLQKLFLHNVGYRGNPSGQEVVVPPTLTLNSIRISHPSLKLEQFLRDVARASPDLETLRLDSIPYGDHVTNFSQFKKLKLLDLGNNSWIRTEPFAEIIKTLPPTLESLYLHGSSIEYLTPLWDGSSVLPKLQNLGLNGVSYRWYSLSTTLSGFATDGVPLEQIGLTNQNIDLTSLDTLFEKLSDIPTLTRIFFYTDGGYMSSPLRTSDVRAAFQKHFRNRSVVLHSSHTFAPPYKLIKV